MITLQEAKLIMAKSLESFLSKNQTINLTQLQAECINNACLYYLKEKTKAFSGLRAFSAFNPFNAVQPDEIGKTFGEATKQLIPQFTDAMIANTSLAVLQNSQWEDMWEFLEKYFRNTHQIDIND